MHGMLSAAVILAAFAVIVLVSGASAVWLFRAAGTSPGRSRSAVTPATGLAPSADDAPGEPEHEADGTAPEYPERTWLGAAPAGTGQLTGSSAGDGWPGPGHPAGPEGEGAGGYRWRGAEDSGGVYDVEDWPGAEDSGDGHDGAGEPGRRSPGRRGWPDTAKSLYSRGWPVMDSSPRGLDPGPPGNAMDAGAAGEPHAGERAAGELSIGESGAGDLGAAQTDAAEAEAGAGEADPAGPPGGARVYVLGESRRSGH
jgi:hypothetical protein